LFLGNTFTISSSSSIHIQFKSATNDNAGYLLLLKFGSAPTLNSTQFANYDLWQLYCPQDKINQLNDSFFLFFASQTKVNGFKGTVGVGIRELTSDEMTSYCPSNINNYTSSTPPVLESYTTPNNGSNSSSPCKLINTDLNLRVYLSGCYYLDTSSGTYVSDGAIIQSDTTVLSTHCLVYHCTEFAGGFVVVPAAIDFDKVFSPAAGIAQNPILYATVFTIVGLYVILAVLCRLYDIRDNKKKGVTMLNEDSMTNLYEVIVFTGNRKNASTDSNVR
jgi:hypothetical protein